MESMGGMSSIQYSHYPTIIQHTTPARCLHIKTDIPCWESGKLENFAFRVFGKINCPQHQFFQNLSSSRNPHYFPLNYSWKKLNEPSIFYLNCECYSLLIIKIPTFDVAFVEINYDIIWHIMYNYHSMNYRGNIKKTTITVQKLIKRKLGIQIQKQRKQATLEDKY